MMCFLKGQGGCVQGLGDMRQPGLGGQTFSFEGFDFVRVAQSQANVVQAIDQAIFAESLNIKGDLFALGSNHHLAL
jgi:hypothetical protein